RVSGALEKAEPQLAVAGLLDKMEGGDRGIIRSGAAPARAANEPTAAQASDTASAVERKKQEVIGGGVWEGIGDVLRSPYLIGIAVLMLLFTITSTYLYFMQAEIIAGASDDSSVRTQVLANIDLIVNVITLVTQLFLTGRILRWFGVGVALAFLPVVSLLGFGIMTVAPTLAVLIMFQILRRAGNYAIQRPAREVLYTVLPRSEKFKAKNFNDTFVYRVGDQVGAWSYTAMGWMGLGVSGLAMTMVPTSFVWLVLVLWLGRRYRAVVTSEASAAAASTSTATADETADQNAGAAETRPSAS